MKREQIVAKISEMAPFYTPEWRLDAEHPDMGTAFALTFADMLSDTYSKYLRLMEKHHVEFRDFAQIEPQKARAAGGFVCFSLANGAPKGCYADEDTPVYSDEGIIYTTTRRVFVPTCELKSVYCRMGDDFYKTEKLPFVLFKKDESLQKHDFYVGHNTLFSGGAEISLHITGENTNLLANPQVVQWEYFAGEWVSFAETNYENGVISFFAENDFAPAVICGNENLYIRCHAKEPAANSISIDSLKLSAKSARPAVRKIYAEDIECGDDEFEPFGKTLAPFACCYFACTEAFSKYGARVDIDFTVTTLIRDIENPLPDVPIQWKKVMRERDFQTPPVFEARIRRTAVEYWNGSDFVSLPILGDVNGLLADTARPERRTLSFICPEDMTSVVMFGQDSMWIRLRIIDVSNPYRPNTRHVTPIMRDLKIRYCYEKTVAPDVLLTENNLKFSGAAKPFYFLNNECEVYFGFDRPFEGSPVGFFWETEPYKNSYEVAWSVSSQGGWKPVHAEGEFWRTGIIMLSFENTVQKAELFGERLVWLKAAIQGMPARTLTLNSMRPGAAPVWQKSELITDILQSGTKLPEYEGICDMTVTKDKTPEVSYRLTAGSRGNCKPNSIVKLGYAVGYICGVTNPLPVFGGRDVIADAEPFAVRGRAVTVRSYEKLALRASAELLKCKCISGIDDSGTTVPGAVTLVYMPCNCGVDISHEIRAELTAAAPSQAKIFVREACRIEISVSAEITAKNAFETKKSIEKSLVDFFHPVHGNFNKRGFSIGELPDDKHILSFLHSFESVIQIESFSVTSLNMDSQDELDRYTSFAVPLSGQHTITVRSYE